MLCHADCCNDYDITAALRVAAAYFRLMADIDAHYFDMLLDGAALRLDGYYAAASSLRHDDFSSPMPALRYADAISPAFARLPLKMMFAALILPFPPLRCFAMFSICRRRRRYSLRHAATGVMPPCA